MPSLSERTFVIAAGKAAKGLAYLAFSVGVARLYSMETYAGFQAWWMIFMIVVPVVEGGFTAGLYHALPRLAPEQRNGLVWRTFWVLTALGAATALVIFLLAGHITAALNLPRAESQLRAVAPFIGAALPVFVLQAWLLVSGRPKAVALFDVGGAALVGAALLIPATTGLSLTTGLAALSAFGVARTLVVAAWLAAKLTPRQRARGVRAQFRFAGHVSVGRAFGVLTKQLDRVFVGAYGSAASFGVYATGALELPLINVLTGSAATILQPEISRRLHDDERAGALALWHESIRKIALLLFPVGLLTAVLARPLFTALYGPDFAGAALVFQIFALALPLRAAQYGAVLLAAGESRRVLQASFVGLALNIGLCLVLVPAWLGIGAAVATVVSVYAVVAFYLPPLGRIFACSIRALFPWRPLAAIAGASVPGAVAAASALWVFDSPWLQLAAGTALFVALTVPSALLLGALREDDRRRLGRYLTERTHA